VLLLLLFPVENLLLLMITTDGFAVGRRAVVVGGNEEARGSYSSAWDCSVHKPVSSTERQVERLPYVGR